MAILKVDGIGINVDHFAAMPKKEAVKRMIKDGFVPGETEKDKKAWAAKVYDLINPSTEKLSPESSDEEA